jgi:hypothetical protein
VYDILSSRYVTEQHCRRYIMSDRLAESISRNAASPGPQSLLPASQRNVSESIDNPQPSLQRPTLDNIPTELIHEIAECLRPKRWNGGGCACQERKKRASILLGSVNAVSRGCRRSRRRSEPLCREFTTCLAAVIVTELVLPLQ